MNRIIDYTIDHASSGLRVEQYLRRRGYSGQIITIIIASHVSKGKLQKEYTCCHLIKIPYGSRKILCDGCLALP